MKIFYSNDSSGFFFEDIHPAIPEDAVAISRAEYSRALDWQSNGGVIAGVGATGVMILKDQPPPSASDIRAAKVAVVQQYMDSQARALNYDSIANAITYAEEPAVPRFQAEGRAFRAWRSLVWERCYSILAEVLAGSREVPTDSELIAELPVLELPAPA